MKSNLMFLAAIIGVSTAYANKPIEFNGTTYYAVSDCIGGWTWTTTKPTSGIYHCITGTPYCTIVTIGGFVPRTNQVPSPTQATPVTSIHSVWSNCNL